MAKIKIQGHASGAGVLTVTAPNTSTDSTITLPDSTGSLIADDGSGNIDVTGVGKFSLDNNGGAGGGIVASNTNASNPALGGYVDLMERGTAFGTANNYGVRLYYDGSTNKFHIQGGNETTVATHLTMVRDSGEVTIDTGDLIFGTAGKGIVLGSTSNTDANTLDDYEEGTWTPNVGGNAVYNSQVGKYTKVGNMVTVWLNMNINTLGTGANNFVYGLPFAVSNTSEFNVGGNSLSYFNACNATVTYVGLYIVRNTANMKFITIGASGGSSAVEGTNFLKSSADIYCTITYKTG